MKKKKIITGLLLVSMAALAFTACGKKTTKTSKTTKNNTQVTTSSKTQTTKKQTSGKVTTEKQTTKKQEIVSVKKCYFNANDGLIAKTDVEDDYLVNATIVMGYSKALMVKPIIKNGKIDSVLFITNASPEKTVSMTNALKLKPSDKFAPVGWTFDEEFGHETSFYITAKVSNDKIEFKSQGKTYSITKNGVIDSSFSEITKPFEVKGYSYTYNNEVLNVSETAYNSNYVITLKKDLFKFDTGSYISQIEWMENKAVLSEAHDEGPIMVKHSEKVFTFDDNYTLNGSSSIADGMQVNTEVSWSNNGKVLTLVSTNTPYSGGYVYPLASIGQKSKAVLTYDDYGRIINTKAYAIDETTETLMTEYNYAFDNDGNITIETYLPFIGTKSQKKYFYTNGKLSKVEYQNYNGEEFVTTSYFTITTSKNGLATEVKSYEVSGETETLTEDCYREKDDKNRTLEYSKLFYSAGKLTNASYKYEYEYNDENDITSKNDYAPNAAKTDLYLKSTTVSSIETGTEDGKKYEKQINAIINYNEAAEETGRKENITTLFEDSEIGYTYETREFFYGLEEYKTTSLEKYDDYYNENILSSETWTYSDAGVTQNYEKETYMIVNGESEKIMASSIVYYATSYIEINHYYYDTLASEIVPSGEEMKYESFTYNSNNKIIHKSVNVYYYDGDEKLVKSSETRDWYDSVSGYIDRSTIYNHEHFIGEKRDEVVMVYNSDFNVVSDTLYEYSFDNDTNKYQRLASIYVAYPKYTYQWDAIEVYFGESLDNIHDIDFKITKKYTYTSGQGSYIYSETDYEYTPQLEVASELKTTFDTNHNATEFDKIEYIYDDVDATKLAAKRHYYSYTNVGELTKIEELVLYGGDLIRTFRGLTKHDNTYSSIKVGLVNEDGLYEKVVSISFGENNVLSNATLYINDLVYGGYQEFSLNNDELKVALDDTLINELFDTENYEEGIVSTQGYKVID